MLKYINSIREADLDYNILYMGLCSKTLLLCDTSSLITKKLMADAFDKYTSFIGKSPFSHLLISMEIMIFTVTTTSFLCDFACAWPLQVG